jgi:tetratricopeptide (TPR) repeat protein
MSAMAARSYLRNRAMCLIERAGAFAWALVVGVSAAAAGQPLRAQNPALDQARRLFAAGSYERAAQILDSEIAAHPGDADAHLLLGQIDALEGRRSEAIAQLSRTIELQPNSAVAYNILGTALNRFAEFDAARKAFEQAVTLDPRMADARINLAMTLAEASDLKGASEQLTAVIKQHPAGADAARAHYLLGKIAEDQDSRQAIAELVASAKLNPRDEQTWLELGSLRDESGDQAGALAAFEQAVACDPRDPEAQYQLGSEFLAKDDARAAVVHLELARKAMPKPTLALLYKLDRALRKTGNEQEAAKVRDAAKALLAGSSDANTNFEQAEELEHAALTLEQNGNLASAIGKYKAALEVNPEENRFRYNYALALCHAGRWQEGIAQLNDVLANDPGNIDARRALFIAMDKSRQAAGKSPPVEVH